MSCRCNACRGVDIILFILNLGVRGVRYWSWHRLCYSPRVCKVCVHVWVSDLSFSPSSSVCINSCVHVCLSLSSWCLCAYVCMCVHFAFPAKWAEVCENECACVRACVRLYVCAFRFSSGMGGGIGKVPQVAREKIASLHSGIICMHVASVGKP